MYKGIKITNLVLLVFVMFNERMYVLIRTPRRKSAADLRMLRLPSDHRCGANAVMGLVTVFLGENRCRSIVQVLKIYFATPVDGAIPCSKTSTWTSYVSYTSTSFQNQSKMFTRRTGGNLRWSFGIKDWKRDSTLKLNLFS